MSKTTRRERDTVTLQSMEFRRVVSALANGAQVVTNIMVNHGPTEKQMILLKTVADENISALAAAAFGRIPLEGRR